MSTSIQEDLKRNQECFSEITQSTLSAFHRAGLDNKLYTLMNELRHTVRTRKENQSRFANKSKESGAFDAITEALARPQSAVSRLGHDAKSVLVLNCPINRPSEYIFFGHFDYPID